MSTSKPFLPDQQCTNVCSTIGICDQNVDKHTYNKVQSCIDQCMAGKNKEDYMWKNMIEVYGSTHPRMAPDKEYCDAVHANMKPSKCDK